MCLFDKQRTPTKRKHMQTQAHIQKWTVSVLFTADFFAHAPRLNIEY